MDNYSTQNFDSCMVAAANQQHDISQSVNSQSQAEQAQTQGNHDEQQQQQQQQQQQTKQTHQDQSNTQQNITLTPVRLPAILDGEHFTVTKVENSNVTVRCSYCHRCLNGNLKSTGNFLSHIKRVHPLLVDKIKGKSSQRRPAVVYVDSALNDKCSDNTRDEFVINKEESYDQPSDWNDSFTRRHTVEEQEPVTDQMRVTTHNSFVMEDEYDAIGRNVAAKLRNMRMDQRIIAEKLLNDILFEAQLGNLSRESNIHV
ncbi:Protein stand still [Harpegnathos saltator]|uniref:Protein stand still n=1 Tax=Harpegnathos saltator TaxID=610380 RepID=E2BJP1_HARSA|nr:Protein stand still [Harpegnathos saltator]